LAVRVAEKKEKRFVGKHSRKDIPATITIYHFYNEHAQKISHTKKNSLFEYFVLYFIRWLEIYSNKGRSNL